MGQFSFWHYMRVAGVVAMITTLAACTPAPKRPSTIFDANVIYDPDSSIPVHDAGEIDMRKPADAPAKDEPASDAHVPDRGSTTDAPQSADVADTRMAVDAPAVDTVTPDSPPGEPLPPPPACAEISDALLCEDFEQTTPIPAGWTKLVPGPNGDIAIVSDKAVQGTRSLKVTMPVRGTKKGPDGAYIVHNLSVTPGNRFFGRVYFLLPQDLNSGVGGMGDDKNGPPGHVHDEAFYAQGPATFMGVVDPTVGYRMSFSGRNHQFGPRYGHEWFAGKIHGGLTGGGQSTPIPVGRWQCIEWEFDGNNNNIRLWVNNEPSPSVNLEGGITFQCIQRRCDTEGQYNGMFFPWVAPAFERFYLGFTAVQPSTGESYVYYDSLVLARTRVGCGRM